MAFGELELELLKHVLRQVLLFYYFDYSIFTKTTSLVR